MQQIIIVLRQCEYNGEYPPYAFPTGIGEGQLGLMLTNMKIKKHNLITGPYALAYTAVIILQNVYIRTLYIIIY